jgi:hypothetical protein
VLLLVCSPLQMLPAASSVTRVCVVSVCGGVIDSIVFD